MAVPTSASVPAVPSASAGNRAAYQRSVTDAVAGIQSYWKQEFPDLYGDRYVPVPPEHVIAAGPKVALPRCQGQKLTYQDAKGNAFYCYGDNFVAYDDVQLLPELYQNFGAFSVALVLAHEWGHAIQDRAGNAGSRPSTRSSRPTASPVDGRRAQSDGDGLVRAAPGDLESSLAALLQFRDVPGTAADDPSAHGSAFDRVNAFQEGFESGPERCAEYFDSPPVVVELPFGSEQEQTSGGNVAAADVIPLAVGLLNDFYRQVEPAYTPLAEDSVGGFDSAKPCDDPEVWRDEAERQDGEEPRLLLHRRRLRRVRPAVPAEDLRQHRRLRRGVADREPVRDAVCKWSRVRATWPTTISRRCCRPTATAAAGLRRSTTATSKVDRCRPATSTSSCRRSSCTAARGVSADVPITFLRVGYFRRGFFSGYSSCDLATIEAEVAEPLSGTRVVSSVSVVR